MNFENFSRPVLEVNFFTIHEAIAVLMKFAKSNFASSNSVNTIELIFRKHLQIIDINKYLLNNSDNEFTTNIDNNVNNRY